MSETFADGYALLIGVGVTCTPRWSLPVTVNDVQTLCAVLTDPDLCAYPHNADHIRLLCHAEATRQNILDGLAWLATRAVTDPDATVVVYYSGHGMVAPHTLRYALIPHEFNEADIPGSVLWADDLTNALRNITARRVLVFVDSCHAEGMATAKDAPGALFPAGLLKTAFPEPLIRQLKHGEGRAVFTSSRGAESSWIRPDQTLSIYTHHLIEALHGAGNQSGESVVRVSNLMNHVGKTVPESARTFWQAEQTPFFDTATEDFPVVLLRGGKGLPVGGWDAIKREATETIERVVRSYIGDGNIIGKNNVSQVVKAEGGSRIGNVRQSVNK